MPNKLNEPNTRASNSGSSLIDAEHPVDALVFAVGHAVYAERDAQTLRKLLRGEKPVLADVKGLYDRHALAETGVTGWRL